MPFELDVFSAFLELVVDEATCPCSASVDAGAEGAAVVLGATEENFDSAVLLAPSNVDVVVLP